MIAKSQRQSNRNRKCSTQAIDFVVFSIFDWSYHSHGHSDFQIAKALAVDHRVLFVNTIGMRFPPLSRSNSPLRRAIRKLRSIVSGLRFPDQSIPKLATYTPPQLPFYSGAIGRINRYILRYFIKRAISRLGIGEYSAIVTLPTFAEIAIGCSPQSLIYNRSDKHSAIPGGDTTELRRLEELLFKRSNAVVFTSQTLFDEEKTHIPHPTFLGHGINLDLFSPYGDVSHELDEIPRPRAAFFGDLRSSMVDFGLVERLVQLRPNISFVLGGTKFNDLGSLPHYANVTLLPPCSYEEMPSRWRGIDVALMPYALNEWTQAIAPIKLNEILAIGLPAVGTPLPAFEAFPKLIYTASQAEGIAQLLDEALLLPACHSQSARTVRRQGLDFFRWEELAERIVRLAKQAAH